VADAAARLARHYIPARYPDAHASGAAADHYRASDALAGLGDLDTVLAAVDAAWAALHAAEDSERSGRDESPSTEDGAS
jgi:HEPN domain-containing protein